MLLKSSDFIIHDLCHAFDCCVDGAHLGDRERVQTVMSGGIRGGDVLLVGANSAGQGRGRGEAQGEDVGAGGGVWESVGEDEMEWRRPKRVVLALRKWFEGLRNR